MNPFDEAEDECGAQYAHVQQDSSSDEPKPVQDLSSYQIVLRKQDFKQPTMKDQGKE